MRYLIRVTLPGLLLSACVSTPSSTGTGQTGGSTTSQTTSLSGISAPTPVPRPGSTPPPSQAATLSNRPTTPTPTPRPGLGPSPTPRPINSPRPTAIPTPTPTPSPTPAPGATPPPGSGGSPTSPFVTRNGSQLRLGGNVYTPVGTNIFWLALDGDTGVPPSQNRVREAFAIAKAMGANTVRAHTLGVSTYQGGQYAILTGQRTYNDANYASIDYAINEARYYGIRLVIPLTDQYHYFHGGKWDFLYYAGAISLGFLQGVGSNTYSQGQLFYTNSQVVSDFEDYISHHLNHTNTHNGIQFKNDPTILAWEIGNELGAWNLGSGYSNGDPPPPSSWAQTIASYIKSVDSQHLVVDSPDGVQTSDLSISQLDIYSRHPYGDENLVPGEYSQVKAAGKVYLIGEFDGTSGVSDFISTLESENQGSLWWSLEGHNDDCSGYRVHYDNVTMTYPTGASNGSPQDLLALLNYAFKLLGGSSMSSLPNVPCQQPELAPS